MPIDVRKALGLRAGDQLDFVEVDGGFVLVPLHRNVTSLRGRFAGRVSMPVSINEMNAAIARRATR